MVRTRRLELPGVAPQRPQRCASTNFATSANFLTSRLSPRSDGGALEGTRTLNAWYLKPVRMPIPPRAHGIVCLWCGQEGSNLHALKAATAEATMSSSSNMPAYWIVRTPCRIRTDVPERLQETVCLIATLGLPFTHRRSHKCQGGGIRTPGLLVPNQALCAD